MEQEIRRLQDLMQNSQVYEDINQEIDEKLEMSNKDANRVIKNILDVENFTKEVWCKAFEVTYPKLFLSLYETHLILYFNILRFGSGFIHEDVLQLRSPCPDILADLRYIDKLKDSCDKQKDQVDMNIAWFSDKLHPTDYACEGLEIHMFQMKEELHKLIDEVENYVKSLILLPYIRFMKTFWTTMMEMSVVKWPEESTREKIVGENQQATCDVNSKEPTGDACLSRRESMTELGKMSSIKLEYVSYRYEVLCTITNWLQLVFHDKFIEYHNLGQAKDLADPPCDSQHLESQMLEQGDTASLLRGLHVECVDRFSTYSDLVSKRNYGLFLGSVEEFNKRKILGFLDLVKTAYEIRHKALHKIIRLFNTLKEGMSEDVMLAFSDSRKSLFGEIASILNGSNLHQAALEEELLMMRNGLETAKRETCGVEQKWSNLEDDEDSDGWSSDDTFHVSGSTALIIRSFHHLFSARDIEDYPSPNPSLGPATSTVPTDSNSSSDDEAHPRPYRVEAQPSFLTDHIGLGLKVALMKDSHTPNRIINSYNRGRSAN